MNTISAQAISPILVNYFYTAHFRSEALLPYVEISGTMGHRMKELIDSPRAPLEHVLYILQNII